MSRDIFVQDIPANARLVDDVPEDFDPSPIGSSYRVLDAIRRHAPGADLSDPEWIRIETPGCSIEVSVPSGDNIDGFAFHVRGEGADTLIDGILRDLGLRAFDTESNLIRPTAQV